MSDKYGLTESNIRLTNVSLLHGDLSNFLKKLIVVAREDNVLVYMYNARLICNLEDGSSINF